MHDAKNLLQSYTLDLEKLALEASDGRTRQFRLEQVDRGCDTEE